MYVLNLTPHDRRDARAIVRRRLERGGRLSDMMTDYAYLAAGALGEPGGVGEALFWARCWALCDRLDRMRAHRVLAPRPTDVQG